MKDMIPTLVILLFTLLVSIVSGKNSKRKARKRVNAQRNDRAAFSNDEYEEFAEAPPEHSFEPTPNPHVEPQTSWEAQQKANQAEDLIEFMKYSIQANKLKKKEAAQRPVDPLSRSAATNAEPAQADEIEYRPIEFDSQGRMINQYDDLPLTTGSAEFLSNIPEQEGGEGISKLRPEVVAEQKKQSGADSRQPLKNFDLRSAMIASIILTPHPSRRGWR